MEKKRKLKIVKKENIILVKRTNNKRIIKNSIIYFIAILILFLFSYSFMGNENALFILNFSLKLVLFSLLTSKLTFTADENLEIAEDKIVLKFGAFGLILKKYELPNDSNVRIEYDDSLKTVINTIFVPSTLWRPGKLRRMKFIYENKIYAYGFALTPKEYDEIKSLILSQRK